MNTLYEFIGLKHDVCRYIKVVIRNLKGACTRNAGLLHIHTVALLRQVPIIGRCGCGDY